MDWRRNAPVIGLLLGVAVVGGIGIAGYQTVTRQAETAAWVEHTHRVIERLDDLMLAIAASESAVRGFALSHETRLAYELEPFIGRAHAAYADAIELVRDNRPQERRIKALKPKLERRIALLREYLARVTSGGGTQVLPESLQLSAELRSEVLEMVRVEEQLLSARVAERTRQTSLALLSYGVGLVASLGVLVGAFVIMGREMRARRQTEQALQSKHAETSWLLEMGELLQASHNLEEAYEIIGRFAPNYFPDEPGTVFLLDPERNFAVARSTWGGAGDRPQFGPDDCWALRRSQAHGFEATGVRVTCRHLTEPLPATSLCLPLLAHGEVMGVLQLTASQPLAGIQKRAAFFAEQVSMALANIGLRERLREEAIRDPLTGLFNRRYTREALERELRRANRHQEPVAVLMMDVDHFKRFNDTFGHQAGDHVLHELGKLLVANTRGSDVVSRMGGEELLAILPGANHEHALAKAEQLRGVVSRLQLVHAGRGLGAITISIGVAVYAQHGDNADLLLKAADEALYQAKGAGRDRVMLAA